MDKYKVTRLTNEQINKLWIDVSNKLLMEFAIIPEIKNGILYLNFIQSQFTCIQLARISELAELLANYYVMKQINSELSKGGLK